MKTWLNRGRLRRPGRGLNDRRSCPQDRALPCPEHRAPTLADTTFLLGAQGDI